MEVLEHRRYLHLDAFGVTSPDVGLIDAAALEKHYTLLVEEREEAREMKHDLTSARLVFSLGQGTAHRSMGRVWFPGLSDRHTFTLRPKGQIMASIGDMLVLYINDVNAPPFYIRGFFHDRPVAVASGARAPPPPHECLVLQIFCRTDRLAGQIASMVRSPASCGGKLLSALYDRRLLRGTELRIEQPPPLPNAPCPSPPGGGGPFLTQIQHSVVCGMRLLEANAGGALELSPPLILPDDCGVVVGRDPGKGNMIAVASETDAATIKRWTQFNTAIPRVGVLQAPAGAGKTLETIELLVTADPPHQPSAHRATDLLSATGHNVMCECNLVIVPQHLLAQWTRELQRHPTVRWHDRVEAKRKRDGADAGGGVLACTLIESDDEVWVYRALTATPCSRAVVLTTAERVTRCDGLMAGTPLETLVWSRLVIDELERFLNLCAARSRPALPTRDFTWVLTRPTGIFAKQTPEFIAMCQILGVPGDRLAWPTHTSAATGAAVENLRREFDKTCVRWNTHAYSDETISVDSQTVVPIYPTASERDLLSCMETTSQMDEGVLNARLNRMQTSTLLLKYSELCADGKIRHTAETLVRKMDRSLRKFEAWADERVEYGDGTRPDPAWGAEEAARQAKQLRGLRGRCQKIIERSDDHDDGCPICMDRKISVITDCGHVLCGPCFFQSISCTGKCPTCRHLRPRPYRIHVAKGHQQTLAPVTREAFGSRLAEIGRTLLAIASRGEQSILVTHAESLTVRIVEMLRSIPGLSHVRHLDPVARKTKPLSASALKRRHDAINKFPPGGVLVVPVSAVEGLHVPEVKHVLLLGALTLASPVKTRLLEMQCAAAGAFGHTHLYHFIMVDTEEEEHWKKTHTSIATVLKRAKETGNDPATLT